MEKLLFSQLEAVEQNSILVKLTDPLRLPAAAIEKDWWVVQTLRLVFELECADSLVFKGGTSLSKAWGLIERFSEDIDLALDRKFLNFGGELSNQQIKKLRKASFAYITDDFYPALKKKFEDNGLTGVEIKIAEVNDTDQDPRIIEIYYPTVTTPSDYLRPKVIIDWAVGRCESLFQCVHLGLW